MTGFDPAYGARPLKRAIQAAIENPLANEIFAGHFIEVDVIEADLKDGVLVFKKKTRKASAA
ncbi:MAG: hypothetical protein AB7Q01_11640 [Gammaproteobacteria bacterium]